MEQTAPLQDLTALVRPELDRLNRELVEDLSPGEADLRPLLDHVAQYRGKQLRPALVMLAAKAISQVEEAHYTVAKVVELLHTATLVHDDILDGATIRRQLATVNSMAGSEIAVLLGDYIYARAFNLSLDLDDLTCSRTLSEVARVICQGEITQLVHRFDFAWTEERYMRVITEKTASLFGAGTKLGAHYAGATPEVCDALETYGIELGIAFQIVDDCLDLRGEEDVVGKSLGTDLIAGKITLPMLHLLRSGDDAEARLRDMMGTPEGVQRLASEFDLQGAIEWSEDKARERAMRGLDAIRDLPATPAREAMEALAHFVVRRER